MEAEPPAALHLLRAGEVDVAMVFTHQSHPTADADTDGLRTTALFDEPLFLVLPPGSRRRRGGRLSDHADDAWIAGCERCRAHLLQQCTAAGFTPRIAFATDDYVTVQSLVAAGAGVSTLPALALAAHRHQASCSAGFPVRSGRCWPPPTATRPTRRP